MSELPIIASLWIGGNLSYIEQVCLKSFADHGHRTLLYTYERVDNAPRGVEVLDANTIFPATAFIRHADSGSPAVHADAFRYKMIALQNVVWVDADMLCMQPWAFKNQWIFGWEKTGRLVCNAVLGLPRFSRTLAALNDFCKSEYPIPPWADDAERSRLQQAADAGTPVHVSALKWGVWGPSALTYFLNQTGEMAHALPEEAFYPVSFAERRQLLAPRARLDGKIGQGVYGVHLWNRRLSRRLVTSHNGLPPADSFLADALARHGIDPQRAPIPDRPPAGHPTQAELAAAKAAGIPFVPPAPAPAPVQQTVAPAPLAAAPAQATWQDMPLDRLVQSAPYQAAIDNLERRTGDLAAMLPPAPAPMSHDKIMILTSMKNEAPFILEWIAYHMAIGVTHFLVYTNDCTDNTNAMLDRLAALGHVTRIDNPWDPASGKKPQHVALQDALDQPAYHAADWVLTIDVDEFVNIHVGDGTFADFFKAANDPNVVSFTWKFFGNGGIDRYDDKPIITQFTGCAPEFIPKPRLGWGFKSMVHKSAPYSRIGVHRPLDLTDAADLSAVRWVNGSGRAMPEMLLDNNGWRSTKRSLGYRLATLNHYILRSADSFLVKRDRGRINHTEQDQGIDYWMRRNYTSETDTRMHNRLPMMQRQLDVLMADPDLAQMHRAAVAWHRDKIAALKADPDYAALYHALTQVQRPDALYVSKPDTDDPSPTDIVIPEPELLVMSPDQIAARTAQLRAMLAGRVSDPAPVVAPVQPAAPVIGTGSGFLLPSAPASALPQASEPRFQDARAHAIKNGGFFWEGPENALHFEPGSKRLVVTFDNVAVVRLQEARWPWGHDVLTRSMGCSVLGVMAVKRNWFRHGFVHDSFDLLRDSGFFAQFDEVLFYGASMGGFGALTYARCAPGARVLAIAPQTTLDRRQVPDDDRWKFTRKLDWDDRYGDAAGHTHSAAEVVTIHDPYFSFDQVQVARLTGDNLRSLRMPFFGHQLPNALVMMRIIKPILVDLFDGNLTDQAFYALLRARRDLPRYQHDLLMRAEAKNHTKLAIRVCEYTLRKRDAPNIERSLQRLRQASGMAGTT